MPKNWPLRIVPVLLSILAAVQATSRVQSTETTENLRSKRLLVDQQARFLQEETRYWFRFIDATAQSIPPAPISADQAPKPTTPPQPVPTLADPTAHPTTSDEPAPTSIDPTPSPTLPPQNAPTPPDPTTTRPTLPSQPNPMAPTQPTPIPPPQPTPTRPPTLAPTPFPTRPPIEPVQGCDSIVSAALILFFFASVRP